MGYQSDTPMGMDAGTATSPGLFQRFLAFIRGLTKEEQCPACQAPLGTNWRNCEACELEQIASAP